MGRKKKMKVVYNDIDKNVGLEVNSITSNPLSILYNHEGISKGYTYFDTDNKFHIENALG